MLQITCFSSSKFDEKSCFCKNNTSNLLYWNVWNMYLHSVS